MKPGTIPSPRQLKLSRFDQSSCHKRAKHRRGEWTWQRAVYSLRRWFMRARAELADAIEHDIIRPLRRLGRPQLDVSRETHVIAMAPQILVTLRVDTTAYRRDTRSILRALRSLEGRQSAPSRLSGRRKGAAHRLEDLATLSSNAYMTALDARQRYVTANLLRLKGLAARRAFGEPSWKEARRADHYATA